MDKDALWSLSAVALAAGLRRGDFTSAEIVAAYAARHAEVGRKSNAYLSTRFPEALAEAAALDAARAAGRVRGPLHGLPLSVKDNIDLVGHPSTLGLRAFAAHRAERDAVIVAALREAGCVVLGKTNVPQGLASAMECDNHLFGPTLHPMSDKHGPGASSSGEAVALATGQSVLGLGTDLGGSIRFPAAYCGVTGLKPTTDRWSNAGLRAAIPGQELVRAQVGPMARSVGDLRLLWQSVDPARLGREDPLVPPVPVGDGDLRDLTVGYFEDDGLVTPSLAVRRALREARAHLEAAGVRVVPLPPPDQEELVSLYVGIFGADRLRTVARGMGSEPPVPPFRTMWRVGRLPNPVRRVGATFLGLLGERRMAAMARAARELRVDELYTLATRRAAMRTAELQRWREAGVSALLCPPATTAAVPIGKSHDFALTFGYTGRYNVLGLPAGVVPVSAVRPDELESGRVVRDRIDARIVTIERSSLGLPLSAQVVGLPWREDIVLHLLGLIEAGAGAGLFAPVASLSASG